MTLTNNFLVLLITVTFFACGNVNQDGEQSSRPSTAQPNVTVLEQRFTIKGLDRERLIRIFLPEGYMSAKEAYPVLYMHDGQNLFDDSTSFIGEWGVDESLNKLAKESDLKLIVVGIDNGGEKRMNELSPWKNDEYGEAEGVEYMEFIVKQLKPFIDSTYRTLRNRENTGIMGSSMGGLISHYAIYNYPDIFGMVGIFSPSYWYSEEVFTFTKDNPISKDARLWLVVGEEEGNMVDDAEKMYAHILTTGHPIDNLRLTVDPEGKHHESSWRKQFVPAVSWLFYKNNMNNNKPVTE